MWLDEMGGGSDYYVARAPAIVVDERPATGPRPPPQQGDTPPSGTRGMASDDRSRRPGMYIPSDFEPAQFGGAGKYPEMGRNESVDRYMSNPWVYPRAPANAELQDIYNAGYDPRPFGWRDPAYGPSRVEPIPPGFGSRKDGFSIGPGSLDGYAAVIIIVLLLINLLVSLTKIAYVAGRRTASAGVSVAPSAAQPA